MITQSEIFFLGFTIDFSECVYRSEIHENMNCIRCQSVCDWPEIEKSDVNRSIECQSGQDNSDIGGFAEISGCLNKLKSSEKQVGYIHSGRFEVSNYYMKSKLIVIIFSFPCEKTQVGTPLEEDLGSWGHHFFPTSVPDTIFQTSAGDEVWHFLISNFLFNGVFVGFAINQQENTLIELCFVPFVSLASNFQLVDTVLFKLLINLHNNLFKTLLTFWTIF